ncbi:DUF2905 domain-containing protein [Parasutterella muris]|mgnify:CR=1 FL=1|jgi:Protein of unknown function (DUF2905).|uniref:DUF2905 family protein n=1 Tax=Parasutterella muris TaxID=2565572 RepID=A0A6L6YFY8_9BURK|nr:DUF2905 domain-containing protein [Parasutterella muris]MVX55752.1 DUF2905 family protein [Parasutterella muris]
MRWILTIFIGLCVLTSAIPWLQKLGIGKLPGDLNLSVFGRKIQIPIASTMLIAVVLMLIGKFL